MRKLYYLFFIVASWHPHPIVAQSISVDVFLFDKESKQPIPDVHGFLVNTTFGDISNKEGRMQISFPNQIKEDLILSHISYDTRLLEHEDYKKLKGQDTIWLNPNYFEVSEVVVTAKRSNLWKKQFKKFRKYFLGENKAAEKCKILNPEVLRFNHQNGTFRATAVDLIKIQNDYLGYEINYLLTELSVKENGSSAYAGKAVFIDQENEVKQKRITKNREEAYLNSPKFFFHTLLTDRLSENGLEMEIDTLLSNGFEKLWTPTRENLLLKTDEKGQYLVQFPEFLKVVNLNTKEVHFEEKGVRAGGLESQKFSSSARESDFKMEFATSYLYKIAPYLKLNEFGNVLNTKVVKEYGYWADQKMAYQLPFDYGNDYQSQLKIDASTLKNVTEGGTAFKTQITNNQKLKLFTKLIYEQNTEIKLKILAEVDKIWQSEFIPILVEFLRLNTDKVFLKRVERLLTQKTGQAFGQDPLSWLQWLWKKESLYGVYYGEFKANYYQHIDPKFKKYFLNQAKTSKIRLDEIVWGGVKQDGIPPLRQPKLLTANEADYLDNNDLIFGAYINGVAKAYPKRILAWHEFFVDDFKDTKVAGVYCTLCGTVIAYDMVYEDNFHDLGTSGFLYRSNKLMYDKATQSLWNTIEGSPILGPLADKNIVLQTYPLVTTTWGEWKKQHPTTLVLSLDTGHNRNYDEGAAYANYFATDDLMFPVPRMNNQLANKAEVLIIRAPNYRKDPLAISIDYLRKKKWYKGKIADTNFVVLADKTGAARAFETNEINFVGIKKGKLKDDTGKLWTLNKDKLQSTDNESLNQLSAHNIFWFAWFNTYPNTRLVK